MSIFIASLPWLVVACCILSEAFFACAEISIVSANAIKLEEAASHGNTRARRVLWFKNAPDRLFGTTLLGTNFSTVTGSTVASLTLLQLDPENGQWWTMLLMAPLVLIGGEIIPKSIGQARANTLAELVAGPLFAVHCILTPLIFLVTTYTSLLYRLLGIDDESRESMASREDLVLLMQSESPQSEILADEREMISRILAFGRLRARDSMIPLAEIIGITSDSTVREAVSLISLVGFSRLPVYEGRIDNVVGILHHLDLLGAESSETPIGELIRPVHFAPETQEVDELLFILQRQAASAAIVVDEFGGAVGLITLEDIMEEIVGEIHDEFDRASGSWRDVSDGHLIMARTSIEELNDAFELDIPESVDYETIAGYLLDQLRHIPRVGEAVQLENGQRLTIRRANARAIQEVHLSKAVSDPSK